MSDVQMSEQSLSQGQVNSDTYNLLNQKDGLSTEFQKWITDSDFLWENFLGTFCGYVPADREITRQFLSSKRKEHIPVMEINYASRIMNEAGARWLYNKIKPMVSQLTSTSNLTEELIYRNWNAKLVIIVMAFSRMALFRKTKDAKLNPYEFDVDRIGDVITSLDLTPVTYKGHKGYTLNLLATSITTATLIKHGIDPQKPQAQGIVDKLKSAIMR